MKTILLMAFLLAISFAKADTITVTINDGNQPLQSVTIQSCDVLLVVNNTTLNTYLHDDTTAAGAPSGAIIDMTFEDSVYYDLSAYDLVVITHQFAAEFFYIMIIPPPQSSFSETICHGDSYLFDGIPRTTSGSYSMTYPSAGAPCDSVVTLNLTVLPPITSVVTSVTICPGSTYTVNGQTYANPGLYPIDTLTAASGCDSVIQLSLQWTAIFPTNVYETICTGQSYLFDGEELTTSGTYTAFLQTPSGCDSIVMLNLTVLPPVTSSVSATICPGEVYMLGGTAYSETGTYTHSFELAGGCDSNVVLSLHVESSYISIYQFDENTLYASSPVTVYFTWMDCTSGTVFEDETGTLFTPEENGFYAVIATENGCPDTSECLPISAIGLEENSTADFFVFPVPAYETITLQTNPSFTGSAFRVVSPAGTIVLNGRIATTAMLIDIRQLASGVYYLQIDGAETVRKILRE